MVKHKKIVRRPIIGLLLIIAFAIAINVYLNFKPAFTGAAINFYQNYIPQDIRSEYPSSFGAFEDQREYRIDPKMTLIDLQNGKTDILTQVLATPEISSPLDSGSSFLWNFSDHRKVADIVWNQTWGDDSKDWSIFSMYFIADCQDHLDGFSIGNFEYFKPTNSQEGNGYSDRSVLLNPLYGIVDTGSGTSYPRPLFGWMKIELESLKVTADDALHIAEENGGRKARLSVNNQCTIFLNYSPNYKFNVWHVSISHNNELPNIFEINIDPYTAKYKIIETGK